MDWTTRETFELDTCFLETHISKSCVNDVWVLKLCSLSSSFFFFFLAHNSWLYVMLKGNAHAGISIRKTISNLVSVDVVQYSDPVV